MQKNKKTTEIHEQIRPAILVQTGSQERQVRTGRDGNPVQGEAEDSNFINIHLSLHFSVSGQLDKPLFTVFIFHK